MLRSKINMHCSLVRWKSRKTELFILLAVLALYISFRRNRNVPMVHLPFVVVHIDMKGTALKLDYLESLLPMLQSHGVNGLLMEYEDMFPYEKKLVNLSARNCYKKYQLKKFISKAVLHNFEIIPLIQTFGHMEHALKLSEFRHLREIPQYSDSICPSQNESQTLIKQMLTQIIHFHKTVSPLKHLHVGFDEVYHVNKCLHCKKRGLKNFDIIYDHIKNIKEYVRSLSPATTVLMWDDMFRQRHFLQNWINKTTYNKEKEHISNIEPVYWEYGPTLSVKQEKLLQYHAVFQNVWIASAFKGADGKTATFPNIERRFRNHLSWMKLIVEYELKNKQNFKGIILTGWSRYSHMDAACELLPVSMPSLNINLVLIEKFIRGIQNDIKDDWTVFLEHIIGGLTNTVCSHPIDMKHIDLSNCYFLGSELYIILKRGMNINSDISMAFDNQRAGFSAIEYYTKYGIFNMNMVNSPISWCNFTCQKLKQIEEKMTKSMTKYYDKDFVNEYVGYKIYNAKNKVNQLLNAMKRILKIKTWPRGPFTGNIYYSLK